MNLKVAQKFLTRCFDPEETIALLLRSEATAKVTQKIVTVKQAISPRYLGWLAYENTNGANIYVAANPLRSGSRKRTKESIASVRHIYIDVDRDGEARIAAIQSSDLMPAPTIILSTSPSKYQALWRVHGFDLENQEELLKHLAITFGGDPACTDCNRVLRVPGFLNRKYDPAHLVSAKYFGDSVRKPNDFRLPTVPLGSALSARLHLTPKRPCKHSTSESDWAWVLQELNGGRVATELTRDLASRRSDKPNPLYYAQRTVDVASARLWMLEGVPHEDIVTMLESRRRFEISTTLCSARAREITATTARMIARNKNCLIQTRQENPMPLLEVIQTKQISASIRLSDTTAIQVDQYAAFIRACADDVVEQALAYVFSKDRDFQEFLKTPEARKVASTLRIRKVPAPEAVESAGKRPVYAVQSLPVPVAVAAGSKA
jgi:hypothetical protein